MNEEFFTVHEGGERIDSWLAKNMKQHSRSYIQQLIGKGFITIGGNPVKSNYRTRSGDVVAVFLPEPEKLEVKAEKIDLDVVFEDEHLIVINKEKGMVVHPAAGNYSGTLVNALMDYCGDRLSDINGVIRPGIVHRIDKDTSGLLVVAKTNVAHEKLSKLLKDHEIKRVYAAIVEGVIIENSGKIDAPIGRHPVDRKKMAVNVKNGKPAVTHFRVLERFINKTYIELKLETGRTHQIRVHMSYIGFPILGDEVYGRGKNEYGIEGQVLHARELEFVHPVTGENMRFEAPLPEYFQKLLNELKN